MQKLKTIKKKHSGRDSQGHVSVRHQGGEHKRFIRSVDFKRSKHGITGRVMEIQYDPNRTADVALINYSDGEKRYILAPEGIKLNDKIIAADDAQINIGN